MRRFALIVSLFLTVLLAAQGAEAFTLNITSDIHAGKKKKRDYSKYEKGNIVYPKEWKKYFQNFLSSPADVYLTLGDNINNEKKSWKKAREIRKILQGSAWREKIVLFTYGNHDNSKGFRYLAAEKYYTYERDNWRIIVLNTEESGGLSPPQLSWLNEQLKTEKKILIAMHESVFDRDTAKPLDRYAKFLETVKEHKNIKYVLSGHHHPVKNKEIALEGLEKTKFIVVQPLTIKSNKGDFLTLNLE